MSKRTFGSTLKCKLTLSCGCTMIYQKEDLPTSGMMVYCSGTTSKHHQGKDVRITNREWIKAS